MERRMWIVAKQMAKSKQDVVSRYLLQMARILCILTSYISFITWLVYQTVQSS